MRNPVYKVGPPSCASMKLLWCLFFITQKLLQCLLPWLRRTVHSRREWLMERKNSYISKLIIIMTCIHCPFGFQLTSFYHNLHIYVNQKLAFSLLFFCYFV